MASKGNLSLEKGSSMIRRGPAKGSSGPDENFSSWVEVSRSELPGVTFIRERGRRKRMDPSRELAEPEIVEEFVKLYRFFGIDEGIAREKLKNATKNKLKGKITEALDFFKAEAEKREQDQKLREIQGKIDKAQADLKELIDLQKEILK